MLLAVRVLLALLVATVAPSVSSVTWTLSHTAPADSTALESLESFAIAVTDGTGGKLRISVGAPVKASEADRVREALVRGPAPIGAFQLASIASDDPLLAADRVPFLATNFVDGRKLWQVMQPHVKRRLSEQGLSLLFAIPSPPPGLLSSRAIGRVQDFQGIKLVDGSSQLAMLAKLTRAARVRVEPPSKAFGTGAAQLMFVSAPDGVRDKAWEYAKFYYHAPAWFPKLLVVVSKRALITLPGAERDPLLNAADRAESGSWAAAERETERKVQMLRDYGIKVVDPPVQFLIELETLGRELLFEWSESAGEAGALLVEDYYAIK